MYKGFYEVYRFFPGHQYKKIKYLSLKPNIFCIHSCIVSIKELKNRRFNMQGNLVLWKSKLKALKKNLRASKPNLRALKMTARGS